MPSKSRSKNKQNSTRTLIKPSVGCIDYQTLDYELPSPVVTAIGKLPVSRVTSNHCDPSFISTVSPIIPDEDRFLSPWKLEFPEDWESQVNGLLIHTQSQLHSALVNLCRSGISELSFSKKFETQSQPKGLSCFHYYLTRREGGLRLIYRLGFSPVEGIEGLYKQSIFIELVTKHVDTRKDNQSLRLEKQFKMREETDPVKEYIRIDAELESKIQIHLFGKRGRSFPRLYQKIGKEHAGIPDTPIEETKNEFSIGESSTDTRGREVSKYFSSMTDRELSDLSPCQKKIVNDSFTEPIILQGRSGTGKSLCILWNMWAIYKSYWEANIDNITTLHGDHGPAVHLHQVFITANPVLLKDMERQFDSVKRTIRPQLGKNLGPLPMNFKRGQIDPGRYPLFLTTRQFVIMIDGTLDTPFYQRDKSGGLETPDDFISPTEKNTRDTTLNSLMSNYECSRAICYSNGTNTVTSQKKEIDCDFFEKTIYPNLTLSAKTKKLYPASLVWKEIYSYIKGYIGLLESKKSLQNGYLSLSEYLALGKKLAPNFDEEGRREIYKIFQTYCQYIQSVKKKQLVEYYDWNDVIRHIILNLEGSSYSGEPIHHITYDEVQDSNQLELSLYFLLSSPKNFFFAGDTCQTIERGIGFRFGDLRSVFVFMNQQMSCSDGDRIYATPSGVKELSLNYRCSMGINQLALHVTDLMKKLFDETFDSLKGDRVRDTENIVGVLPRVIFSEDTEDLFELMNGSAIDGGIGFGAHQVVIVRDEETKKGLPDLLKKALCVTVLESKGMEYDDVILYDFFREESLWKVIEDLNTIREKGTETNHLSLSSIKESIQKNRTLRRLSDELKYLYVAITRGIRNVWFIEPCDGDVVKIPPVIKYFIDRDIIECTWKSTSPNYKKNDSPCCVEKRSMSKPSWRDTGIKLLELSRWYPAQICFERAGDEKHTQLCKALLLQAEATREKNPESHLRAAKLFLELKYYEKAASSLFLAGDYSKALDASHRAKRNDFTAFLYEKIGEPLKAVDFWLLFGGIGILHGIRLLFKSGNQGIECLNTGRVLSLLDGLIGSNQLSIPQCESLFYVPKDTLCRMIKSNLSAIVNRGNPMKYLFSVVESVEEVKYPLYFLGCKQGIKFTWKSSTTLIDLSSRISCYRAFLDYYSTPKGNVVTVTKNMKKEVKSVTEQLLKESCDNEEYYSLLLISLSRWLRKMNMMESPLFKSYLLPGRERKHFKEKEDFIVSSHSSDTVNTKALWMVHLLLSLYDHSSIEKSPLLMGALFSLGEKFYSIYLPRLVNMIQRGGGVSSPIDDALCKSLCENYLTSYIPVATEESLMEWSDNLLDTLTSISDFLTPSLRVITRYKSQSDLQVECQELLCALELFRKAREEFVTFCKSYTKSEGMVEKYLLSDLLQGDGKTLYSELVYDDITSIQLPFVSLRKCAGGTPKPQISPVTLKKKKLVVNDKKKFLLSGIVSHESMKVYKSDLEGRDSVGQEDMRLIAMFSSYLVTLCSSPWRVSYSMYDKYFSEEKRVLVGDEKDSYYDILDTVVDLFKLFMKKKSAHPTDIPLLLAATIACSSKREKKCLKKIQELKPLFNDTCMDLVDPKKVIALSCEKQIKWTTLLALTDDLSTSLGCGAFGVVKKQQNGEYTFTEGTHK